MATEYFDVVIVGAGISGISAGYYLQARCPKRTYVILEARGALGGTWDVFRYPGVRTDSDMTSFGYTFEPWQHSKTIADGPELLDYLRDTAAHHGVDRKIRFGHTVKAASWSSPDARWTVDVERGERGETGQLRCNFLFFCAGYYDYSRVYIPSFRGRERFRGRIVHPQDWTDEIDYTNKRVIVIGSGATAVTLIPQLAKRAAHVTMLQRSPSYLVSRAASDPRANRLRRHLPARVAFAIIRWRGILFTMRAFRLSRLHPERAKVEMLRMVRETFDPEYVAAHLTPRYTPWDQRPSFILEGDLFAAIREGRVSLVTDEIDTLTERGLTLRSGAELDADLIVSATGPYLRLLGGAAISVDGQRVDLAKAMTYKGMMYSGIPNLASAIGYLNATWTLKVELTCQYVCRLLNRMEKTGKSQCVARLADPAMPSERWTHLRSGYVERAIDEYPRQGSSRPWKLHQNYALDWFSFRFSPIEDGVMELSHPRSSGDPSP